MTPGFGRSWETHMPLQNTYRISIARITLDDAIEGFGLLVLLVSAWFAADALTILAAAVTE